MAKTRSGKSTVIEALAELCGLPVGGGSRNELADLKTPQHRNELAAVPARGVRQETPEQLLLSGRRFRAHFATLLLEERQADPEFAGDPYARYGGRSLHTRSHGEAFLSVLSSWMTPGLILMDEPEAALSPQRQLSLLVQIARLARDGGTQFVIASLSNILMTSPGASLISFDGSTIQPTSVEYTSHFRITRGLLDHPDRYWKHLLSDDELG